MEVVFLGSDTYNKQALLTQLAEMGIRHDDTLMVHSSMKSMGAVDGGAETVLDALCEYLCDGLLVMPTHTWHTINDEHSTFDPATEPSCTGILGTLLLNRPGAVRSLHPSHSVAAYGKDAERFVENEQYVTTPCAREGCMGKLLDRGGRILFIGVPLTKNTFIHGVEEWNGIENRLSEPSPRYIVMPNGSVFLASMCSHKSPAGDISLNYGKLEKPFLKLGAATEGRLGDARCVLCDCRKMLIITSQLLIRDPDLFLSKRPITSAMLKNVVIDIKTN